MIECKLCGKKFRSITNTHLLHSHGISVDEYTRMYGNDLVSEETRQVKRKDYGINWETVGLGTKPDSIIANEIGIERRTVTYFRNKMKIPAFVGVILLQEGEPCRSIYEGMYDAYLHWQRIEHEHEVRVGKLPYIADFKVGDTFIEITGMIEFKRYEGKFELKKAAYQQAGIKVKWLSRQEVEEIYATCPVKVNFRETRVCIQCGKHTYRIVKNVCPHCYMLGWRNKVAELRICEHCGKEFQAQDNQKFCSHECYSKSLEFNWPSWEWIEEQLKTTSIRQLALQLGIKPTSMYMHLRRRRERNNGKLV